MVCLSEASKDKGHTGMARSLLEAEAAVDFRANGDNTEMNLDAPLLAMINILHDPIAQIQLSWYLTSYTMYIIHSSPKAGGGSGSFSRKPFQNLPEASVW